MGKIADQAKKYVAVTKPIVYVQHKSETRIVISIIAIWVTAISIGLPIPVIHYLTNEKGASECGFSPEYSIVSSILSFFMPCFVMIYLYYEIFRVIRERAKKPITKRPRLQPAVDLANTTVIENVSQTRRLADTSLSQAEPQERLTTLTGADGEAISLRPPLEDVEEDRPTNNTSNSQEEEDEDDDAALSGDDNCYVIKNPKSEDVVLTPLKEEKSESSGGTSGSGRGGGSGGVDGGPVANNGLARGEGLVKSGGDVGPRHALLQQHGQKKVKICAKHNGAAGQVVGGGNSDLEEGTRTGSAGDEEERGDLLTKKERKASAARFTIYKVNKASRKKREKSSARRERKTTLTLAVVLGVFLLCWIPFFVWNNVDACYKLLGRPKIAVTDELFNFTTWLGYMNSFLNPVIYTIFNPEFRKAFKRLLVGPCDS